ncbi:MAG: 4Fe-4S cluster-binding domain-containing protein [Ruminococcaceae bacterium]|nr:4Fe-4S cluster-binding domain-containing protein [Oscillospiraceae bacterium]
MLTYKTCTLCPRVCGIDRTAGERGFCAMPGKARVGKIMRHYWEEPALAGAGGSGAIFFSGCTLGCLYCQNEAISREAVGQEMDSARLRAAMEELIAQGAENIDLVTPTHFLPDILPALTPKLPVPVVYNCGGYERVETLRQLDGLVDIYLPDLKYGSAALAGELSRAEDYFSVATKAIEEMVRQVGPYVMEGEKLRRGVLVRHLILPGQVENSLRVLDYLGESFPKDTLLVSLMRQYTPMPRVMHHPDLCRTVTQEEYEAVLSWMYLNGLKGFTQEAQAAAKDYIPNF